MKRYLLVIALLLAAAPVYAQYNEWEARADYKESFAGSQNNFTWQRICPCDKGEDYIIAQITSRISVTTITESLVIGKIEDVALGAGASFSRGRLPWDGSTLKADVTYTLIDGGYIVTASRISYLNEALDKSYSSVYGIIYNKYGDLRKRGDGDLRYFDNAFCDLLIFD